MIIDNCDQIENNSFGRLHKAAEEIRNGRMDSSLVEGLRLVKQLNNFGGIDRINEGRRLAEQYEAAQMKIFSGDYLPDYKTYFEKMKTPEFKPREINVTVEIHNCDCGGDR